MADFSKAIERVKAEIEKISNKENNIYFFVYDTKGYPNGCLSYIYNLALILNKNGYKVEMLYQESEDSPFEGVGDWLGEEYMTLKHTNVGNGDLNVSPTDILFIPDVFAQVMNQTKKLPCKRIGILQNFDYMVEQMPFSAQWGDFGILEAITNADYNTKLLHSVFPYVKTTVIPPFIDKKFGNTDEPKEMVINIIAHDQNDINKIVKNFYWKYPTYKWVSFKDLRGLPQKDFATALRNSAITIWIDEPSTFGYSALEAMKSGSIVIAKIPKNDLPWASDPESGNLKNCCIWFDDLNNVQKQIASAVRSWTTDKVPATIHEEAQNVVEMYTEDRTTQNLLGYIERVNESRKMELEKLIEEFGNKNGE